MFVHVLEVAAESKVFRKVGTVSVDGTKIQANASKHSAVSYGRARQMLSQLEQESECFGFGECKTGIRALLWWWNEPKLRLKQPENQPKLKKSTYKPVAATPRLIRIRENQNAGPFRKLTQSDRLLAQTNSHSLGIISSLRRPDPRNPIFVAGYFKGKAHRKYEFEKEGFVEIRVAVIPFKTIRE